MKLMTFAMALVVVLALLASCASDSEDGDANRLSLVTVGGPFTAQVGGLQLTIPTASIGTQADQVPPGSLVRTSVTNDVSKVAAVLTAAPGGVAVGPTYRVSITNPNGGVLTNVPMAAAYTIRMFPDAALMAAISPETTAESLRLVRLANGVAKAITLGPSIVADDKFTVDSEGWVVASVTVLGDFILMSGGSGPGPSALTGTLTEIGGILAFNLSSVGGDTVVVSMPATAIATIPATVSANPDSYIANNPTAATNRAVILTSGGTQFTSFNTGGNATIAVSSRAGGVSAGTITGTLRSSTQASRTVSYSFTTTVQGGGTGPSLALEGTRFDLADTAIDAHAVAVVYNGTEFVAAWLGADGAQGRQLSTRRISTTGTLVGTQVNINPNAAFSGGIVLSAAYGDDGVRRRILVVGSNAANTSGSVIAIMLDHNGAALAQPLEIQVTTAGGEPRVVWNDASDRFVVIWTTATGISAATYDTGGMLVGVPGVVATLTAAQITAASSANTSEVFVTYTSGTGVKGRRYDSATAAAVGAEIEFSAAGAGGTAGFDSTAAAWIVAVHGSGQRSAIRLAPGSNTPSAGVNLLLPGALQVAASTAGAVVFSDFNTVTGFGTVFSYQGVGGGTTVPVPHAAPISPQVTNQIGFPFHNAQGPLAIASNGANVFLVVASDRNGEGVTAIRLRLNTGS